MHQPPHGSDQPFDHDEPGVDLDADAVDSPFEHGPGTRQITLLKHGQRYVFRYPAGQESSMLGRLIELADDPSHDLDWFDAAVLSHQMGHVLGRRLESLLE